MENKINYAALSLDEIIFIGRNKDYGAYDLRRSYNENVKRAILGTIFFSALAVGYQGIFARLHLLHEQKVTEIAAKLARVKDIEITTPTLPKKPNLPPQPPKGVTNAATVAMGEKKPVSDKTATQDTIPPIDDRQISDVTLAGIKGATAGTETGTPDVTFHVAPAAKEPETVTIAEVMPEFPGGESALLDFLRNHISYPEYESETGIQGKAIVSFVVDEKGKVGEVKIVRGVSKGIDRESIRVINMLPAFTPGMQAGRTVRVRYTIPLDFHLRQD